MLRITPLGFAVVATVAVLAFLLGLFNWGRGAFALRWAEHGAEENARQRYEIEESRRLIENREANIQATQCELQLLREELRAALVKLEAARREPSVELLSEDLKTTSQLLANESAEKVKALHDAARLAEEVEGLKREAKVLQDRNTELEKRP